MESKLFLFWLNGSFLREVCTQEEALQKIAHDPQGAVWLDTGNGIKLIRDNAKAA